MEERKKRFPGLSLPDDTERVQGLLEMEGEGRGKGEEMEDSKDVRAANEALNEVSLVKCV